MRYEEKLEKTFAYEWKNEPTPWNPERNPNAKPICEKKTNWTYDHVN